ncbi:MAG: TonB-dependent receptor, partial [Cyclobacteriaceae bacterium]|nr:TonB-dependent receptor [Cyclobacteriaceae bacterium]
VQGEFSPIKNLRISGALRSDAFVYNYTNYLSELAFSGAPDSRNTFTAITPKIGLTYDLGKSSGFYANWSKGFGPPQVSELYRGVKVPTLEPANFANLESGIWVNLWKNMAVLDMAVYSLHGVNEIISVKLDDGTVENRNAGETMHRGIEYGLVLKPLDVASFRFSGTNAKHTFINYVESGADYSGNIMSGAPPLIINAEATYKSKRLAGFRIGLEWQHVQGYYLDDANTEKYEGYDLYNLRLSQQLGGFECWFHVLNLTDTLYSGRASKSRWGKSYNMGNPRTFDLGVVYRFAKD